MSKKKAAGSGAAWLKKPMAGLPPWAKRIDTYASQNGKISVCIEADTDAYVPFWFKLLGVMAEDGTYLQDPDQYWLEVAYQCAKMDLQLAITNTEHDPRDAGMSAEFRFSRSEQWPQSKFPPGRGATAATQGHEARDHFRRIRGRIPFTG